MSQPQNGVGSNAFAASSGGSVSQPAPSLFDSRAVFNLVDDETSTPTPSLEVKIQIKNLPSKTTQNDIVHLLLFASDITNVEFTPSSPVEEQNSFLASLRRRVAVVTFATVEAAEKVRDHLQGKRISQDADPLVIEFLSYPLNRSRANGTSPPSDLAATTPPPSMLPSGMFPMGQTMDYMNARSTPTQPPTLSTGKSLIQTEDDNYGQMVKESMNFMKISQKPRRATNPTFPGLAMSVNTNVGGMNPLSSASINSPIATPHSAMPPTSAIGTVPPSHNLHFTQFPRMLPAANPADQNPPCNTLYVGNLPMNTSEDELKALFSRQRGYKRLSFRTKNNGPMCFVEFEDVAFATRALNELYGRGLSNSVKGGIRLSFSKNPLGVRTPSNGVNGVSSPLTPQAPNGFPTTLHAPPGLGFPGQPSISTPTGTVPPQLPGTTVLSPLNTQAPPLQNNKYDLGGSGTMSANGSQMDLHGLLKKQSTFPQQQLPSFLV